MVLRRTGNKGKRKNTPVGRKGGQRKQPAKANRQANPGRSIVRQRAYMEDAEDKLAGLNPQQVEALKDILDQLDQGQMKQVDEPEDDPMYEQQPRGRVIRSRTSQNIQQEPRGYVPGGGLTGRGLGRGQGRLPREFDFEALIAELPEFDPAGRNKYADTLPVNLRASLAALGETIQNLNPEAQELLAQVWEETLHSQQ